jgi:serine/threonine protein kinase
MLRWFKRSSTATESPPGAELEAIRQYRVTRKLGEGGMGVVYEARDERLDRLVAIKRVRGFDADTSLKQRLWREARVAAAISHPNICQVYELAEERGELFVVMVSPVAPRRLRGGSRRVCRGHPAAVGDRIPRSGGDPVLCP